MTSPRTVLAPAALFLTGWTVFLWVSRLRNVVTNDELSDAGRNWRIAVVAIFVGLGIAATIGMFRRSLVLLRVLVMWSIGYWIIRGGGILIGDWSAGFKIVHTVLMAVTLGLCAWVMRTVPGARWSRPSR